LTANFGNTADKSMALQKHVHFLRQLPANPFRRRDLINSCPPKPIHRAEPPQQQILPVLAHPGAIVEDAFFDAFFHQQLMIRVGEPMRFISDALKQSQGRRIHWKSQRQRAAGPINFLVFFRQPYNREIVQFQSLQFTTSG
jgi:hypothetical protein